MEPEDSLPRLQEPATDPKHDPITVHINFCGGEELLTPCPTAKWVDYPLSTDCVCLYNTFEDILHI